MACAEQRSATNCQHTNSAGAGIYCSLMLTSDDVRHLDRLVHRSADHSALPLHHCNNPTSVHSDGAQAGLNCPPPDIISLMQIYLPLLIQ